MLSLANEAIGEKQICGWGQVANFFVEQTGGDGSETLAENFTSISDRGSVQVGAARSRGGGGVGNFVGAGGHDTHVFEINSKLFGGDAPDVCVNALTHLGATVVYLHGAVLVKQAESARLVQRG